MTRRLDWRLATGLLDWSCCSAEIAAVQEGEHIVAAQEPSGPLTAHRKQESGRPSQRNWGPSMKNCRI